MKNCEMASDNPPMPERAAFTLLTTFDILRVRNCDTPVKKVVDAHPTL
jgi:hypothetical protein